VERNSRRIIGRMRASGSWPEELDPEDADTAFEEIALSTPSAASAELDAAGDDVPQSHRP
jgi:hypothetical protein